MTEQNLHAASIQWNSRPDDQRFTTLDDLKTSVMNRKNQSWTCVSKTNELNVRTDETQENLLVEIFDPTAGERKSVNPTNWGFSQLSQYAKAPASYLKSLPAPLAAINLQWGLEKNNLRDDTLILGQTNGENLLRSMTSTSYGRIYDIEVVNAVLNVNHDNRWKIPAASYASQNPKRATTLYASDRDVFIFLVDDEHPIEVNGEQLFRGFYTWNSEVGAATFGLTTFLYRYVCDNRIIWGATEVRELKIRHTSGAPDRFAYEGANYLKKYADEATFQTVETIKKADKFELPPSPDKSVNPWESFLKKHGFNSTVAKQAVNLAKSEEGEDRSLWNIINGVTAYARQIPFTDERTKIESAAGNLLNIIK